MATFSASDEQFMAQAIALASQGEYSAKPNPCVGCVVVNNNQVVGQGWHRKAGEPHAEVHALAEAAEKARGATAYVTLEPCSHHGRTPPCANALLDAGVARVVVAMQDPNPLVSGQGVARLREAGLDVSVGLLQSQAEELNKAFCHKMISGEPLIIGKVAMSLDAKTAMASGESQWITGAESRQDVHRLRARSDLVLTGIATVLADDPQLTARDGLAGLQVEPARIVVLDSRLKVPLDAAMFSTGVEVTVLTTRIHDEKAQALNDVGCQVVVLPSDDQGRVDLLAVKEWLGKQAINSVMLEAGAVLNGALLKAGLLDELVVYMAPSVLGVDARSAFDIEGIDRLADKVELALLTVDVLGQDIKLKYKIKRES